MEISYSTVAKAKFTIRENVSKVFLKILESQHAVIETVASFKLNFYTNLNVCTDVGITPVDEIFI